jgi:PelA/Pel-15E family pectate lyase
MVNRPRTPCRTSIQSLRSAAGLLACALLGACGGSNEPSIGNGMGTAGSGSGLAGSSGAAGTTGAAGSAAGTTGTAGASGTAGATGAAGSGAIMLDQVGNPLSGILITYPDWLSTGSTDEARLAADKLLADNMMTWQLPNGGFYKHDKAVYAAPWNGTAPRSDWHGAGDVELGTIDNGATVTQAMFLGDVYRRSNETKYRDAARKALDFMLTMQAASGGFPQVYPARVGTTYSNYITFNDDAMVRVLAMLDVAKAKQVPLGGDLVTDDQLARISTAISKGIDFILKSQITQGGVKTVWCAQHDPTSYEPRGARSYELPSKSGKESIGVIAFLMSQPQTPEIKAAAQAAVAWYKRDVVKLANTAYVSRPSGNMDDSYNPIQARTGSTMWYRFYDLAQDTGFFSGRLPTDNPPGTGKQYDIMDIEAERRYGYQWGGSYGTELFTYTNRVGY